MSEQRTLVFGAMPHGATPATHIAAGAWCFAGQEEHFSGWWNTFPLPADPYPDDDAIEAAAKAANGEVLRLVAVLGEELGRERGKRHSPAFWEMALGPWLVLCVHMLTERQKRMLDLVALYGDEPLRVEILPEDCPFSFSSTRDLMIHGVQSIPFNLYVFSRMVEALAPKTWTVVALPRQTLHQPVIAKFGAAAAVKNWLRDALRDLPFPRQKGFALWQSLLLSLAVLLNERKTKDATIDFSRYCEAPQPWLFPAERIIGACLPTDLRAAPIPATGNYAGRLRGMTAAFSQDDRYRLSLGAWREGGGRLFCVQHGANYGNLRSVGGIPTEYRQHAFFSWGWKQHGDLPVNAVPLPHPSLTEIYDSHHEKEASLILVGTEMSTLAYRLKSRPQSGQLVQYREDKVRFLRALTHEAASGALYRPYFAVAGGLEDAGYVQRRLREEAKDGTTERAARQLAGAVTEQSSGAVTGQSSGAVTEQGSRHGARVAPSGEKPCGIDLCTGDLTERMLGCRLLVLDHYGTTLHMAFAANVPTLLFWQEGQWGMEFATKQAIEILRLAGIFHSGPEETAAQASRIWADVSGWWQSEPVQAARRFWIERYALCAVDTHGTVPHPRILLRDWFSALHTL